MTLLPALLPTGASSAPTPPPAPPEPSSGTPVILSALAQLDPVSGLPEIALSIETTQSFNIVPPEDASFETGIGTATAVTACEVAQSDAEALDGIYSLAIMATTGGAMEVTQGPFPVEENVLYSFTAAYRAAGVGRIVTVSVAFYDGDTYLSTVDGTPVSDSDAEWQDAQPFATAVAPSGANAVYVIHAVGDSDPYLSAPSGLSVTPAVTGSTAWDYRLTALSGYGETPPSAVVGITDGASVLNGTDYNALSWDAVSGAMGYKLYRGRQATYADLVTDFSVYASLITAFPTYADLAAYVRAPTYIATVTGTTYHDTGAPYSDIAPPSMNTTGETHYVDEVGVFYGVASAWTPSTYGSLLVVRSDGNYVLGASPLYPFAVGSDSICSVIDQNAPYGLTVTYVATAITGGVPSPPSVPSDPVTMLQSPDTWALYQRLGWAQEKDSTGILLQWLAGIGQMMNRLDSISRDSYDTNDNVAPSWSTVLDINRCPTDVLPWLGQFVGARVPPGLRDDQARYLVEHVPGWARGTPAAIIAAAGQYLIAGYGATLLERDTSPYHLTIEIPTAGVQGDAVYGELFLSYATYAALNEAFATYADMWSGTAEITDAIAAAIPAGLVAEVSFT